MDQEYSTEEICPNGDERVLELVSPGSASALDAVSDRSAIWFDCN